MRLFFVRLWRHCLYFPLNQLHHFPGDPRIVGWKLAAIKWTMAVDRPFLNWQRRLHERRSTE